MLSHVPHLNTMIFFPMSLIFLLFSAELRRSNKKLDTWQIYMFLQDAFHASLTRTPNLSHLPSLWPTPQPLLLSSVTSTLYSVHKQSPNQTSRSLEPTLVIPSGVSLSLPYVVLAALQRMFSFTSEAPPVLLGCETLHLWPIPSTSP
jgi:hypothetical protein